MANAGADGEWQKQSRVLAADLVPEFERKWNCVIEVDCLVLDECIVRASETLGRTKLNYPNEIKQAGHLAFWIRKLKPLRVVRVDDFVRQAAALQRAGCIKGDIVVVKAMPVQDKHRFLNEFFSVMVALGMVKAGGYSFSLSHVQVHDIITSMRYDSYSPSALTAILAAYCRKS